MKTKTHEQPITAWVTEGAGMPHIGDNVADADGNVYTVKDYVSGTHRTGYGGSSNRKQAVLERVGSIDDWEGDLEEWSTVEYEDEEPTTLHELYESQSLSGSMFDYINDQTGFAEGDEFENEEQVRDYFDHMNELFNDGEPIPQHILDEMAEMVIDEGWHIEDSDADRKSNKVNAPGVE